MSQRRGVSRLASSLPKPLRNITVSKEKVCTVVDLEGVAGKRHANRPENRSRLSHGPDRAGGISEQDCAHYAFANLCADADFSSECYATAKYVLSIYLLYIDNHRFLSNTTYIYASIQS